MAENITECIIGNISKAESPKGEALTFDMLTDSEKASLKGEQGERGYTPLVELEYDKDGNLYYSSDGTMYPPDYIHTHDLATKGYVGKLSELRTIDKTSIVAAINELYELCTATRSFVTIKGGAKNWFTEEVKDEQGRVVGTRYGQKVEVENAIITFQSKVDLQVTSAQMVIFYEKDIAFTTENHSGQIYVYCVGNIPEHDYKLQAVVTEVV